MLFTLLPPFYEKTLKNIAISLLFLIILPNIAYAGCGHKDTNHLQQSIDSATMLNNLYNSCKNNCSDIKNKYLEKLYYLYAEIDRCNEKIMTPLQLKAIQSLPNLEKEKNYSVKQVELMSCDILTPCFNILRHLQQAKEMKKRVNQMERGKIEEANNFFSSRGINTDFYPLYDKNISDLLDRAQANLNIVNRNIKEDLDGFENDIVKSINNNSFNEQEKKDGQKNIKNIATNFSISKALSEIIREEGKNIKGFKNKIQEVSLTEKINSIENKTKDNIKSSKSINEKESKSADEELNKIEELPITWLNDTYLNGSKVINLGGESCRTAIKGVGGKAICGIFDLVANTFEKQVDKTQISIKENDEVSQSFKTMNSIFQKIGKRGESIKKDVQSN